jgi:hypothetical protein
VLALGVPALIALAALYYRSQQLLSSFLAQVGMLCA